MKRQIEKIKNEHGQELQFVNLYKNIFRHTNGGEFSKLDKKLTEINKVFTLIDTLKEKELK